MHSLLRVGPTLTKSWIDLWTFREPGVQGWIVFHHSVLRKDQASAEGILSTGPFCLQQTNLRCTALKAQTIQGICEMPIFSYLPSRSSHQIDQRQQCSTQCTVGHLISHYLSYLQRVVDAIRQHEEEAVFGNFYKVRIIWTDCLSFKC